jgi:hypothetical protein
VGSVAIGAGLELDRINPVRDTEDPDPAMALEYQRLRVTADRVATTVAGLDLGAARA